MHIWPGQPYPLGATWDGEGVNFALFSEHATRVELCLFETPDSEYERCRMLMPERTDHVWHVYLPHIRPGQLYGYRVHGPYTPEAGHRFNPNKLLLDPYAKAIVGRLQWHDALYGYRVDSPHDDLRPDLRNSAPYMPRCLVIDPAFAWEDDRPPRTPWHRTVIYEMHVKGLTAQHPDVPQERRGTYLALTEPVILEHLGALGITAVELLPVHSFFDDRRLVRHGLRNYWGYNSLGFFAPTARYATNESQQVNEFKTMVKALHSVGIEVILDVVYNHTGESHHLGPTLCFRGIDNTAYYRLHTENPRHYTDYTGCGNTFNTLHPRTLQLVMDSLRYWVQDMHVDGFRFDLTPALAREEHGFERWSAFLDTVHQDPVLSHVKLIAEPWDLGEGGYQTGNFPVRWTEWNDKYRDTVRRFWRGDAGQLRELGYRLTGSSDLFERSGRSPQASINFVTVHDGFTLHDLVSYNDKHNTANGEDNRDGSNDNWSWNGGVEGPTDDPVILALRAKQQRNFLATLFFSQGVPMLCAGAEIGHTQHGNNNPYCQDNALSWLNWSLSPTQQELWQFTCTVSAIFHRHPVFQRQRFLQGRPTGSTQLKDLTWLQPDGHEMTEADWANPELRALGLQLAGDAIEERGAHGERSVDDTFVLLLNAQETPVSFVLPIDQDMLDWELVLCTDGPLIHSPYPTLHGQEPYALPARSLALLRRRTASSPDSI